jgi:hypothetical protein
VYKIAFDYPKLLCFSSVFGCAWAASLSIPGLREYIRGLANGVFWRDCEKRGFNDDCKDMMDMGYVHRNGKAQHKRVNQ